MPRARLNLQLELSANPGSIPVTDAANEQNYLAPSGTNGEVLTIVGGVPDWAAATAGPSNLALGTLTGTTMPITNDNGTGVTLTAANATDAGVMIATDKVKLDFITITQAVDLDALEQDVADLTTLTGVASNAVNLGTFTGVTIADNVTVKAALQALETAVEAIPDAENHFVADIAARDALTVQVADQAWVTDASADATVGAGGALYIWSGAGWVKMSEFESLDLTNSFSITDGTTTEVVDGGNTITFTGTNALTATVSATDTLTLDVTETVENFTPAAAATTVTVAGTVRHGLKVYRNGLIQDLTTDYTVAGSVVTFGTAFNTSTGGAGGERVKVVYYS